MVFDSTQMFWLATTGLVLSALILKHVQREIDRRPCHQQEDPEVMRHYCELLGVEKGATIGEVRKAYKSKAKSLRSETKETGDIEGLKDVRIAYEMLALGARYGTRYSDLQGMSKR